MKTYPDANTPKDCAVGFEIDNIYVGILDVARTLNGVDGVTDVRARRLFGKWEEIHVWFKFRGHDCVVMEPFGDNSRYWIGPQNPGERFDFSDVESAFQNYRPSKIRKVLGDVLSFQIVTRHFSKDQNKR